MRLGLDCGLRLLVGGVNCGAAAALFASSTGLVVFIASVFIASVFIAVSAFIESIFIESVEDVVDGAVVGAALGRVLASARVQAQVLALARGRCRFFFAASGERNDHHRSEQ